MSIAPSRENEEIRVFGIQTLMPKDIMQGTGSKQAVPLVPKMYTGTNSAYIGCAPISPVIGSASYLPNQKIGHCYSETGDVTSSCSRPDLQVTAPASLCTSIIDTRSANSCKWEEIDVSSNYKQVENVGKYPFGNLLMTAPTADKYKSPEWTTVLNGGGCNYPPYVLSPGCQSKPMPPGLSPASCSPTNIKCTYPEGTENNIYNIMGNLLSPGWIPPPSPCLSVNPTSDAPAAPWQDATCTVFYDPLTRAYVSLSMDGQQTSYPVGTDLFKPTIFNNVPFNYDGTAGNSTQQGSYCYVPDPENACPKIGDVPGKLHGVAKTTQQPDWINADFNEYDNKQHLLCEYNPKASLLVSDAPGGFIKNKDDFDAYTKQKLSDNFFVNYQGFPYNDTIYQYIMLEKCLEPVEDEELKYCMGIDGNYGPYVIPPDIKKNPIGMKPADYWHDGYRLDPMLHSKLSPGSKDCVDDSCIRTMAKLCNSAGPTDMNCFDCITANKHEISVACSPAHNTVPPKPMFQYCNHCRKEPVKYQDDTPRCTRMNKSTSDGEACRKWYKSTVSNIHQAVLKSAAYQTNPDFSRAIYYNNCLRDAKATGADPTPCGPVISSPASGSKKFTPPEEWTPWPSRQIKGQIPIYKPGSAPASVDWEATRKKLLLGNSPGGISDAFNKKTKEFCEAPGSQYLWECGCINASAESPTNQNYYSNLYKAMQFAPTPDKEKYKEGYFAATKNQEDAKYCWLSACKFPFGASGLDLSDNKDAVRLADPTLAIESQFQNTDMSVCPEYDCESITIVTPDSFIDEDTMTSMISAAGGDQVCTSVKNSFWIDSPIVCSYGPSANALNGPDVTAPGWINLPPGTSRDPGNWCYDSRDLYPAGSPQRKVKLSDQKAFMLESGCFNGCHNWSPVARQPQTPQPYAYPTFNCESGKCVEYIPGIEKSPGKGLGLGQFFNKDDCVKECKLINQEQKRAKWYIIIIIIAILAGFLIFFGIRKYLKYKTKVRKYKASHTTKS